MAEWKKVVNMDLKNSLVIWDLLFGVLLLFWIWKMGTEFLKTAFTANLQSCIGDWTVDSRDRVTEDLLIVEITTNLNCVCVSLST